jgi:hypothetical protein
LTPNLAGKASELLFMMAEDLPLPRLAWDPTSESFSKNLPRKRVRLSSPPISSDPAVFSSDDDPSADNYTQERRKKKFQGPWYRQRPASDAGSQDAHEYDSHKKSKRRFERQFDSGVFMGSDGTDMDESMEEFESGPASLPLRQSRATQTPKAVPTPEELARAQIQRCLEDGDESIDLSYVFLEPMRSKLTYYSQVSRSHKTFKCYYPTPRDIYAHPTCHGRSLHSTRTEVEDLPRLKRIDHTAWRTLQSRSSDCLESSRQSTP